MTSAFVGSLVACGLAVDDPAGSAFGLVDTEAGAVPEAGFGTVGGTEELTASPLLGDGVLLGAADEIVGAGPGFAGCEEVQPESAASAVATAHSVRRADRCRGRCGPTACNTMTS